MSWLGGGWLASYCFGILWFGMREVYRSCLLYEVDGYGEKEGGGGGDFRIWISIGEKDRG